MMWLTQRLAPDFKTIADFRRDNGPAIWSTCRQFIALSQAICGLPLFAGPHARVIDIKVGETIGVSPSF
jgi:hypothetical protein